MELRVLKLKKINIAYWGCNTPHENFVLTLDLTKCRKSYFYMWFIQFQTTKHEKLEFALFSKSSSLFLEINTFFWKGNFVIFFNQSLISWEYTAKFLLKNIKNWKNYEFWNEKSFFRFFCFNNFFNDINNWISIYNFPYLQIHI